MSYGGAGLKVGQRARRGEQPYIELLAIKNCFYCDIAFGPWSESGRYHDNRTFDHKLSHEDGGKCSAINLVSCCSFCNSLRDSLMKHEFSRDYLDFAEYVKKEYKSIRQNSELMLLKYSNFRTMWVLK